MFQQRLAVVSERPVSSPEVSWPHQLTSAIKPWANPPAPSPLFLYPCMLSLPCQQRVSLEKPIKTFSPFTRHMFNCWLLKKKNTRHEDWAGSWWLVTNFSLHVIISIFHMKPNNASLLWRQLHCRVWTAHLEFLDKNLEQKKKKPFLKGRILIFNSDHITSDNKNNTEDTTKNTTRPIAANRLTVTVDFLTQRNNRQCGSAVMFGPRCQTNSRHVNLTFTKTYQQQGYVRRWNHSVICV